MCYYCDNFLWFVSVQLLKNISELHVLFVKLKVVIFLLMIIEDHKCFVIVCNPIFHVYLVGNIVGRYCFVLFLQKKCYMWGTPWYKYTTHGWDCQVRTYIYMYIYMHLRMDRLSWGTVKMCLTMWSKYNLDDLIITMWDKKNNRQHFYISPCDPK